MTPPLDLMELRRSAVVPIRIAYSRPFAYFTVAILILATIALSIFATVLLSKRTRGESGDKVMAAGKAYGKEFMRIVAQARRVLHRNSWMLKSATERKTRRYVPINDKKKLFMNYSQMQWP